MKSWLINFSKFDKLMFSILLLFIVFILLLSWGWFIFLHDKILPGVSVATIPMGYLSTSTAVSLLKERSADFINKPVRFLFKDTLWEMNYRDIDLIYKNQETVENAYVYGRQGKFVNIPQILNAVIKGKDVGFEYTLNQEALDASLSAIANELYLPGIPPSLKVLDVPKADGSRVEVEAGEEGREVDLDGLRQKLDNKLKNILEENLVIEVGVIHPDYASIDIQFTKMRAESLLGKSLKMTYADSSDKKLYAWGLNGKDLVEFLAFNGDFNQEKIASYSGTLAGSINHAAQNATFVFSEGRVKEFTAAKDGLYLPIEETATLLTKSLVKLETENQIELSIKLPVQIIAPAITNENVNSLGIKELLGRGVSTFHGSIANREHNIVLAASRLAGYLIPPGEIFSFNNTVGDVSTATGFRQAYIIREGKTILDDGGGVCQVSTTLFRAILDAGLPVIERRAHSYRVGYYEQNNKPGYDATVFAPSVDLKFKNDTPSHLLLQTKVDTKANSLEIEFYGTADGRQAAISNHRIWDIAPPPPDLYQDDPTLPSGTIKQVDWKAWGAKVKYDYVVKRNEEVIFEKTFYSNYQPWQNVFLRGTGI